MTLDSSSVSLFLTRHTWGSHRLWNSYSLEYSSWCHVLISAWKLQRGLCLFSSLKSERKKEGGKGSALNLSLGGKGGAPETLWVGQSQTGDLSLQEECRKTQPWKMCEVSMAAPTTELFWWTQVGHESLKEHALQRNQSTPSVKTMPVMQIALRPQ